MSVSSRNTGTLVVVADEIALAREVADRFVTQASEAIAARGRFDVALAGGSTPKAAYALLASAEYRERVDWTHVRFYFSDERCVPPDDAESNYRMAREAMLAPLEIPDARVLRMHGEDAPERAAANYAAILRELGGEVPVLDLVMLGMGPDGHTASLFPGTDPFLDDALLVRAPLVEKFGTHRLTFTPRTINAARDVQIATAGTAKTAALATARSGAYDPTQTPIQSVAPTDGRLTWLVDRAAAGTQV
jgi:6-phosphogluconolactonase